MNRVTSGPVDPQTGVVQPRPSPEGPSEPHPASSTVAGFAVTPNPYDPSLNMKVAAMIRWKWGRDPDAADSAGPDDELAAAEEEIARLEDVMQQHMRLTEAVLFAVDLAGSSLEGPGDGTAIGDDQKILLVGCEPGVSEDLDLYRRSLIVPLLRRPA